MINTTLVTVGTTKYDELLKEINKEEFFNSLVKIGCKNLIIQYGNSILPEDFPKNKFTLKNGTILNITTYKFKFDNIKEHGFKEDMIKSDLIISHAGSGTILDSLELKKKIIVVPNETLMDNHQSELADAMSKKGVIISSPLSELVNTLNNLENFEFKPFLKENNNTFVNILDDIMGFEI
ncbi:glycosyl transferase [Piromyces finnis]|uniref:UDP-N-acetylglucosamine transferase subunit ALG13 n=1 Tax=Piromyces finnis TaxID=1754191 RepID=A0A1Y1V1Y7_9FUNG|nr:glycosyl transferase [Piromyces finnis]|eukprot:ORX45425.1 glycosyl transferase [Piromyces finnis]